MAGTPADAHTSSMYCKMMSDSQMGLPLWSRTGTFLWTGLESRRSWLLPKGRSVRSDIAF
ncbi:hypothetical protein EJ110_NYTH47514 [Nymphaea thermarum]|nr:hypothetical protein EJ110_NYTH47514 [Nymphaea thermarum]